MNKDELSKLSGEENYKQPPKLDLPIVKIHGRKGDYRLSDKENEKSLGKEISGIVLKIRRSYSFYSKTRQLFSNESDTQSSNFALFEGFESKKGERSYNKIDEGTGKELKERHPELKTTQVLYFLLAPDMQLVKLQIKGSGLGNLYEYLQNLGKDEHIFSLITVLNSEKKIDQQEIPYYSPTFAKGKELDEEEEKKMEYNLRMIAEKLGKIEEYNKERFGSKVSKEKISTPEIKAIDADNEPPKGYKFEKKFDRSKYQSQEEEDDIDPATIPF